MSKHLTKNATEIVILQKNLKDLQAKLDNYHERILELMKDKNVAKEELVKERQLLVELEKDFSSSEKEASDLIGKQIEDWPDVVDSKPTEKVELAKKPKKSFSPKNATSYAVKKGEKWTRIKPDGSVEYIDIQPGEWD